MYLFSEFCRLMRSPRLYIALPVLNESQYLPGFLASLEKQDYRHFSLVVCVNQYDHWWYHEEKKALCEDNRKSIDLLAASWNFPVRVIDRSSPGKGWPRKKGGVGYARKTAMDAIAAIADDTDIVVSMDADTFYPPDYLAVIADFFEKNPSFLGLSLPYYHKLAGDARHDRLLLRYEMYMRYFALNMIRIGNPYRFTALGSAMAFPVWAYRKVGGLTPVQSGEDFYFLQKLVKTGSVGYAADTVAYPSARFSDRVNFGTGPALIKGASGNWDSYPFYPADLFDKVGETFRLFRALYEKDVPTPMDAFLKEIFKTEEVWGPLRENYKDRNNFVRACINKVDGLRILQFLKKNYSGTGLDVQPFLDFMHKFLPGEISESESERFRMKNFEQMDVEWLSALRDKMVAMESEWRKGGFDFVDGIQFFGSASG
jgi:glycosyltransferase involved in cell wall biosynthesis